MAWSLERAGGASILHFCDCRTNRSSPRLYAANSNGGVEKSEERRDEEEGGWLLRVLSQELDSVINAELLSCKIRVFEPCKGVSSYSAGMPQNGSETFSVQILDFF